MAIYTYQVDHGEENPSVGAKDKVNGGKLLAFSFENTITKNTEARERLEHLMWDASDIGEESLSKLQKIMESL